MNDLDLCLEVVSGHVNRCVTFDVEYLATPLEIERFGSKELPIGNGIWAIEW